MVSIIGAGPAGSYTAYLLAKNGQPVNLYEEHKEIGKPIQCSGIITNQIKKLLHIPNNLIQNKIKYMQITAPNNQSTIIKLKEPDLIINRTQFDQYLATKAKQEGAKIHLNHKLQTLKNNKLKFKNKILKDTHIIGADGPNSIVGKSINQKLTNFLIGSQVTIKSNFQKDIVQTFPIKNGFAWIIPTSSTHARVGLLSTNNTNKRLNNFLKQKIPKGKIIDRQGGLIPLYNPNLKTQINNTYLIGDAASMVKATTGGGIIPSIIAAKQLSKSITQNKNYHKLWKNKLHNQLKLHLIIRNTFNKFTKKDLNKLISITNKPKPKKILSTTNRDTPIKLVTKLLLNEPRYFLFLKNLI
jgi:digeranylgeranylglycerophospholipid reductase